MAKRATVQPRWLDEMLWRWGINHLRQASRGLGYPSICVMLRDGIPTSAPQKEPWEYSAEDYRDLEAAIASLEERYQLVIARAYRPWRKDAVEAELRVYGANERTWIKWLHRAAEMIEQHMARAKHDA